MEIDQRAESAAPYHAQTTSGSTALITVVQVPVGETAG